MSDQFVGEIRIFGGTFCIEDWAYCDGTLISINQNSTLYSLFENTYGGTSNINFALPDLRSRIAIGQGVGPALTPRPLGQMGGSEAVTLNPGHVAPHTHTLYASNANAGSTQPAGQMPAVMEDPLVMYAASGGANQDVAMSSATLQAVGDGSPHDNMMPSYGLPFIIALTGVYPDRQ